MTKTKYHNELLNSPECAAMMRELFSQGAKKKELAVAFGCSVHKVAELLSIPGNESVLEKNDKNEIQLKRILEDAALAYREEVFEQLRSQVFMSDGIYVVSLSQIKRILNTPQK